MAKLEIPEEKQLKIKLWKRKHNSGFQQKFSINNFL